LSGVSRCVTKGLLLSTRPAPPPGTVLWRPPRKKPRRIQNPPISRRATHQVRAGDQFEDRQVAGPDDSAIVADPGGSGHPITLLDQRGLLRAHGPIQKRRRH